jgi:hypothetical protein
VLLRYAKEALRKSKGGGGGRRANVIFGGASVMMFRIGHRARLQRNWTNINNEGQQAAEGLAYIHKKNVIYYNISIGNLYDDEGNCIRTHGEL